MSLFPDLEIYGHGSKGGLDPNGSPLQALLQRNQFEERQCGEPFRTMPGGILARVRTPIKMPRLDSRDDHEYYPLSIVVKSRDLKYLVVKEGGAAPRSINLRRDEVYQVINDRDDPFPMRRVQGNVPEEFLGIVARGRCVSRECWRGVQGSSHQGEQQFAATGGAAVRGSNRRSGRGSSRDWRRGSVEVWVLLSSAVEPHPGCRSPDEGRPTECRSLVSQDLGAAAPDDSTECRSLVSQDPRVPQPR